MPCAARFHHRAVGVGMAKHIFVTGGVVSSLGKGITAASLGRLLKSRGLKVTIQKFDPYLNVDPGTMSPFQHGEVFVTDDGAETDLDLGHYERFVDESLTRDSNITSGSVYYNVIRKERKGDYLGGTVQVIPHVTNEIKERIARVARNPDIDVVITEIGGTVGDIESLPFLEAIRQFRNDVGRRNVLYIHVTLIPFITASGELKTKPTQHSVNELRSIGIQPDIIVCRSDRPISQDLKEKIALFTDVEARAVISCVDAPNIYFVPAQPARRGPGWAGGRQAGPGDRARPTGRVDRAWSSKVKAATGTVRIALVGKYVQLQDAYLSVVEALQARGHPSWAQPGDHLGRRRDPQAGGDHLTAGIGRRHPRARRLWHPRHRRQDHGGLLCPREPGALPGPLPGAADGRGRVRPQRGGMAGRQLIGVRPARPSYPVIDLLPEQKDVADMGGTMRLGASPTKVVAGTKAPEAYRQEIIYERHRHRYEVNNIFRSELLDAGLVISGTTPDERLVELIELPRSPLVRGVPVPP